MNKELDTIVLYVKKDKAEEIIGYYSAFGFTKIEEKENDRYEDLVDLSFTRPHEIENKDELQLNQVYLEENLNELGKLEKNKHAKTTSFGLYLGSLSVALIGIGVLCLLNVFNVLNMALSISTIAFGSLLLILELVFLPKIYKKENLYYQEKKESLILEIDQIITKVSALTGGAYGKN